MADQSGDWTAKANDALAISLVTPESGGSKSIASFNPKFTYPIFGDEETVFGYQGLKIQLRYHACDMRPGVQIAYNRKFKPVGETVATDINAVLGDFLPQTAFEKSSVFNININDDIYKNWKPPGELLKKFHAGGVNHEVWVGNMSDKTIQQMAKRVQILIPLFIEGGQAINLSDPEWSLRRWTVFFLYQKRPDSDTPKSSSYVFMGYSTVYQYFHYPLPTPPTSPSAHRQALSRPTTSDFHIPLPGDSLADLTCRSRISQFLILPPFQGGGNGSRFYETIFLNYLNNPQTIEITVEDPNEAFDDLRDLNDLKRLREMPEFIGLRINRDVKLSKKGRVPTGRIVNMEVVENLRRKTKIAPRQFLRLVEMQLLSLIPTSIRKSLLHEKKQGPLEEIRAQKHEYHLWQLFVKQRLYRHNKDTLIQLDRAERIDKLDDALGSVEADYGRLLRTLGQREGKKVAEGNGESSKKRAASIGNDLDMSSKRARVSEE